MRRELDPQPYMRCTVCRGELILQCVKAESADSDADIALYHCDRCGYKLSLLLRGSSYEHNEFDWRKSGIGNRLSSSRRI